MDNFDAFLTITNFLKLYPVRKEVTGERNLEFSKWLRKNCRPSKTGCHLSSIELGGFVAYDLDFILWDYERRMMQLLEVKTHLANVKWAQNKLLRVLDQIISHGAENFSVKYLGLHVLRMDNSQPFESNIIYWDEEKVTQMECWRRVNMLDYLSE